MLSNLEKMFKQADSIDIEEGLLAYQRYHSVMKAISEKYQVPLSIVIAIFVSTSPNNDYVGNLRSTVSIIDGILKSIDPNLIVISTYNHCKFRAIDYLLGRRNFLAETKGPKITNFYQNILDPTDNRYVTIDGHMSAIWQGKNLTMKEALINKKTYNEISHAVKQLAFRELMLPNQVQAILWFTRKRLHNIKAENQFDLMLPKGDLWKTSRNINEIKPFKCLSSSTRTLSSSTESLSQGQLGLSDPTG